MTNKQLGNYCSKPIITDKDMIRRTILNMATMPVPMLYDQKLIIRQNGTKMRFSERNIRKISECVLNSMFSEKLFSYDALCKCSTAEMLKRIKRILLTDRDEGWVCYMLSLLYYNFAINMKTGEKLMPIIM